MCVDTHTEDEWVGRGDVHFVPVPSTLAYVVYLRRSSSSMPRSRCVTATSFMFKGSANDAAYGLPCIIIIYGCRPNIDGLTR